MSGQSVWQTLTHDSILATIEEALGEKLSNLLLQRNSYINRVYELEKYDSRERLIVKFYRPGRWTPEMIEEEHEFLNELAAKEIPVIPPMAIKGKTISFLSSVSFSIFPKKGGRALDEFNNQGWEELGRLLARIHLVGATHRASRRITWRPAIATLHHLETLLNSDYLLANFREPFQTLVESFIEKADPRFDRLEFILLHGDCHKGNLIHRQNEGIYIVDFDDLCFGPPIQDIWLLLPDTPDRSEKELTAFMKGYKTFREFDWQSLEIAPLLRGMRIVHFAAWLAVQSREPGFANHFPEAGKSRYWNELIKELQEIISQIDYN